MTNRPASGVRVLVAALTTAVLGVALLSGCARPGQLGQPLPSSIVQLTPVAPVVTDAAVSSTQPAAGLLSSGLVDDRVSISTTGPAEFSVATEVLAPGQNAGWHRHPGTELTLVRSGEVTVRRGEDCEPVRYTAGDGFFVGDGEPHVMRNEGSERAELVVTRLLTPGTPEETGVEPAC